MIKSLQFSVSYGLKLWTSGDVSFIGHSKKIQASKLNQYEKNGIQTYIPVKKTKCILGANMVPFLYKDS
jgi:hypothetical protein